MFKINLSRLLHVSLNKCEFVGLPSDGGLSCNGMQAYLLSQLENTLHHDSDSMEFMRKTTQVYKQYEADQVEVLKTVRDFITGYCDALAHVNMTGEREIVEISSDEEGEDNDTKVQQEIDESSFLSVNWVDLEDFTNELCTPSNKRQRTSCLPLDEIIIPEGGYLNLLHDHVPTSQFHHNSLELN